MELIKYSLKRTFFVLPIMLLAVFISMGRLDGVCLMEAYPGGFVSILENTASIVAICFFAFMFHDRYEIEEALVCGVTTTKLVFTRFTAILIYSFAAMSFVLIRYELQSYPYPTAPGVPFYAPEHYKLYALASAFVTVLFFAGVTVLIRTIFANCYVAFGVGFALHDFISHFSKDIRLGNIAIENCFADPFMSSYILSDKVPRTEKALGLSPTEWTCNRLMFFGLALVILFVSFLLLKREKLHRGFTE